MLLLSEEEQQAKMEELYQAHLRDEEFNADLMKALKARDRHEVARLLRQGLTVAPAVLLRIAQDYDRGPGRPQREEGDEVSLGMRLDWAINDAPEGGKTGALRAEAERLGISERKAIAARAAWRRSDIYPLAFWNKERTANK